MIYAFKPETHNELLKVLLYGNELYICPIAKTTLSVDSHRARMTEHVIDTF